MESQTEFVTSTALEAEIKSFCLAHSLTRRECEILGSLVEGVVRIKDIASRMSLSPNTVNNHVNSIFVKTKARSKSQLLSHLLTYVAEELQAARAFRRKIRVAIVDADAKDAQKLAGELNDRGFEAASFVETVFPMKAWPDHLDSFKPEFIVVESVSMAASEAANLIDEARKMGAQVAFCGQTENPIARRNAMANGAIEWFGKPCDSDGIASLLMANAIPISDGSSLATRAILFEKKAAAFKMAKAPIKISNERFGAGGLFISNDDLMAAIGGPVQAGDWLSLQLQLDKRENPSNVRGQIVWRASEGESPGAGLRFSYVDPETQAWLANVVRERGSRSYIPAR